MYMTDFWADKQKEGGGGGTSLGWRVYWEGVANLQSSTASLWRSQGVLAPNVVQDLWVGQFLVWEAAKGHDLVDDDPQAPDVTHGGEDALRQALWGHPSHWQLTWGGGGRGWKCFKMGGWSYLW